MDESIRTWWCADGCKGEWLQVDLGQLYAPHSIQLNFADETVPLKKVDKTQHSGMDTNMRFVDSGLDLRTQYILEGSVDGKDWFTIQDLSNADTDLPHPYFVLDKGTTLRYVRLTGIELPYGKKLAVSGIRVFGLGNGSKCAPVTESTAKMEDPMTCRLTWKPVANAQGYNVRYGIAPDKLYSSWLVYDASEVLLTTLNAGQNDYYVIDSFNENGVTQGSVHPMVKV